MTLTDTTKFYTSHKRVVYGGGGIRPDVYVPYDTNKFSSAILNLLYSDELKAVVWDYYIKHRQQLQQYPSVKSYSAEFKGDELVSDYLKTLEPHLRKVALDVIRDSNQYGYFRLQMKAQLARVLYRNNGYYLINSGDDKMIKKAREILSSHAYSTIVGG